MKRLLRTIPILALLAPALALALQWRPSVALDVEPGADADTFNVRLTVNDLGTGATLGNPSTVVAAGKTATLVVGSASAPPHVVATLTIDPTATRASWQWDLLEHGESMAQSRGIYTLKRPPESGY
jgi:hypothetical protein